MGVVVEMVLGGKDLEEVFEDLKVEERVWGGSGGGGRRR